MEIYSNFLTAQQQTFEFSERAEREFARRLRDIDADDDDGRREREAAEMLRELDGIEIPEDDEPPADQVAQQPTEPPAAKLEALLCEIHLYNEKHEKQLVASALGRYGLTLADLERESPGFWKKSRKDRDQNLHAFVTKHVNERDAEKAAAKALARKPPISGAERTRNWRAKRKASETPTPAPALAAGPIPFETPDKAWVIERRASLRVWVADDGPRQRQLRSRVNELVKAAAAYQTLVKELGRAPSHAEFAARLKCSRPRARNMVGNLTALYSRGGPWHPDT